jgi:hypothetical protein
VEFWEPLVDGSSVDREVEQEGGESFRGGLSFSGGAERESGEWGGGGGVEKEKGGEKEGGKQTFRKKLK